MLPAISHLRPLGPLVMPIRGPPNKDRPKAVSIASAREIVDGSDNLVGVREKVAEPEPGHSNRGGGKDKI